jgi:hypothetical protein
MSEKPSLVGKNLPGSEEYKAEMAKHAAFSQKLGEDLVKALNAHTKEHGYDYVANTTPVDPARLAAALAADPDANEDSE